MNENINLCKLLKGHEGEKFYTLIVGYVELTAIRLGNDDTDELVIDSAFSLTRDGKFDPNGECIIFPSKDQRDWNKWAEEQELKVPKTWSELIQKNQPCSSVTLGYRKKEDKSVGDDSWTCNNTPIEKSALALLKIHQLIEVGYGGNITNEEWKNNWHSEIRVNVEGKLFVESTYNSTIFPIAFHTKEQAEEFLSYPENVQFIKDFYMI